MNRVIFNIGDSMKNKVINIENENGFTLIELLAVIVILGVLMITAIPAVTKYINNSKKDTFADSALAYINSARYSLLNDEYAKVTVPDTGDSVCIPLKLIDVDKATKSSYGGDWDTENSYVKVKNENGKVTYSIAIRDTKNYGTKAGAAIDESDLTTTAKRSNIVQGVTTIPGCKCSFGTDNKTKETDCTVLEEN